MITQTCRLGHEFGIDGITNGSITAESFDILQAALDAHELTHPRPAVTHIRKQVARKRGDGFYKVKYSESENGSQTLCGAPNTSDDMGWGEARYAKNLAFVTCDACRGLR
jgi:predicted nucleic acid-binding Zn ribbon protein